MANLYVIGTPIGNLEDITLRALRILGSVYAVLCEDTRVTKKLLERHDISTRTISYHTHSKMQKVEEILSMLEEGKDLALVSDAGTPGISDPGSALVATIRERFGDKIKSKEINIEAVPGPSALTAGLSIAGLPVSEFVFFGFLPHKKGRETIFKEISESSRACIFYESPHRIIKTLTSLVEHLSDTTKKVCVCREITKIYEEVVTGSPAQVLERFSTNTDKVRGEFVVIVS